MHGIKRIGMAAMLSALMMSLVFSAQDASVLLEKAIYTEETLGKLSDAINIYKQIIASGETNRTIGALALYRMGMCYRKNGNEADAQEAFSILAQLYPEQKDLIAKSLLLVLRPAPWADGEIMRLAQNKIGAQGFGAFGTYIMESTVEGAKPAWTIRYLYGSGRTPQIYSVAVVDAATMIPTAGRILSFQTDLEARYAADKIEVLNLKDSAQPPKQIASTGAVYDVVQIIPLLRCLPLREKFQVTIPLFVPLSGSFINVKFSVVARETMTAPAGSFDCYKVVMTADGNAAADWMFWISADSHAYPVKAYIDANAFELKSVEIAGKNQLVNFQGPESGIGLSAPRQWYLSLSAKNGLMLSAPELNSSLNVTVLGQSPVLGLGTQFVEVFRSDPYRVLPQTRESVSIAGLTGERFIGETRDATSGESLIEYAYCLVSQTKRYTFIFQTEKNNFDKMKPAFESIMSSLRVNRE
jgi:hypothetical protein